MVNTLILFSLCSSNRGLRFSVRQPWLAHFLFCQTKEKQSMNRSKKIPIIIGACVIFAIIIGIAVGAGVGSENNSPSTSETGTNSQSGSQSNTGKVTMGEMMALASAKNYLRTLPFSKSGLKKQLEYEGYSDSESTYAVNNCGANWKEQAVRSAGNYLRTMPFSRQQLQNQLEYEGYTSEEAAYGVEQAYK